MEKIHLILREIRCQPCLNGGNGKLKLVFKIGFLQHVADVEFDSARVYTERFCRIMYNKLRKLKRAKKKT